ncbi:GNAT family N-acetyltransferase [Paenibacillus sp. Marseille-P2973]|uniref:GNAT family N-acetyltransferase n=1 Tax=Paenibacillus sp. Marseille-P2973 TaxID=1871032 RepID=UPI001B35976F|nr:GNAT family N-acetyltransferase [Paenibacillus sp. Marseille-P2973]MBQ4898726.1 GNAT family N-acetyltransferase [Paenibacillus sp. Marseille-P2973]
MIETERLVFRRYTTNDLALLFGMTNDPDVMRYIRHGRPWTMEETIESLNRFIGWNEDGIGLQLAFSKEDGKLIGHSGLIPQTVEGNQEIEVGYWVVKEAWGKGYGFEQAKAWKEYGLNQLGLSRLVSLIHHGNIRSMKVAEKNGMKHEKDIDFNNKNIALFSIDIL